MVYFTYLIYVFTFNLILKNLKCNNDHTTYQKTMIILTLVGVVGPIIYIYIYIYVLGRGPCSRTPSIPKIGKRYHRSPC